MKRASDRWNLLAKRSREMMRVGADFASWSAGQKRKALIRYPCRHSVWAWTHSRRAGTGLAAMLSWPGNEETRKYFLCSPRFGEDFQFD